MKSSTAFSILALAASAAASPVAELEGRTFLPPGCNIDNQVLILGGLNSQLCSAYLQATSTATIVNTAFNTAFTTSTSTQTVIATSTVIPVPSSVCGVVGFANAAAVTTFFNNDGSFTAATCQAKCVSIAAGSFATGSTLCACYAGKTNDVVAPAAGSPYTFSDVTCPSASSPVKRAAAVCAPASAKTLPWLLQLINPGSARISSACNCLLKQQAPAACIITKYTTVIATTTIVQVQPATVTNTVTVTAV